uniref:CCHC-type domain-containing protein n=1 Tax=Tanacetum cinerariifolium TaxID=118510 RepID=A0A699HMS3_TANCI|nr:hypothetical protein [Tanacetum cinerariifolium]
MAARGQNHGKGKNKQAYAPKPKIPLPPKSEDLAKDSICHECGETRHWKRNCPQYLVELLKKKKNAASGAGGLGIFVIELNTILNRSWIYDTGCGTHICNTTQGLRASEAIEATGVFYLCLPSGLEIVLNNCHYAPSITRGVISVFCLYEDGFINRFVNNTIQVSRNNMVYFSAIPRDGIFEIDLSNSYKNKSSIYAVNNKRAKLDLDSALLWHCHLGHISKKRIKKLQHDGLLNLTDLRAFEKWVFCISGKMARKPYTHQVERAKDLLGLIHTNVCGPFKIMSRQGASYFITFTDDYSRYGYVYLLKHKHEVFETFKVFQKEVEYQPGKTIKSLCSNHGGEYICQEFLDHLKDHDMVRSMMSQTTLRKSFWDYALETAACILNMVLTKKVEKAPYEVWHGQDPKLSYLKVWGCEALVKRDTLTKPDKSTRTRHALDRMCLYIDAEEHELGDLGEPANYKAALLDPKSEKWLNAMNVEMQSMKDNRVWVLVELPPNGKTVGCKWLLKKKTDMDRVVHTYKACLVAKGYTQTQGIDYEETFSPVADIRAIRILIAITAYYDYEIWQMDVKIAFLKGYLNEEVYMEQPKGFVNPKYPHRQYCMENSKRGSILMQEKLKLSKSQGASTPAELKRMQNVPYALAVGSIMYDARYTLPDVAVSCYTDAGYLMDADDLKSLTGHVFVLNGGAVDWKSAKQSIFATSSAEAEYIATFDAFKEAVWVRKFISGLDVVPTIEEPISMHCNNTGGISIANESGIIKGA